MRPEMPDYVYLVGYADDLAAVITSRRVKLAQIPVNQAIRHIKTWMEEHGLKLAIVKTEMVLLTRNRISTLIPKVVEWENIKTTMSARYLGVILDNKLNFRKYLWKAFDKATAATYLLGG